MGIALGLVAVATVGASNLLLTGAEPGPEAARPAPEPVASVPAGGPLSSTLVVGTRQDRRHDRVRVTWLTLLSFDAGGQRGSIVYIPAHTAAEIPAGGSRASTPLTRRGECDCSG